MSSNAYGRGSGDIADIPISSRERAHNSGSERDLIAKSRPPQRTQKEAFQAKHYGELKPGTPPIMVGGKNSRQVSSGNDFASGKDDFRVFDRRDVSGKIVEEWRGGVAGGWGTRFRKVSGL